MAQQAVPDRTATRAGRRPSRRFMMGKALRDFLADECLDRSAALTLFSVLAIPPLVIMLTSVLALAGQGPASTDTMLEIVGQLAPDEDALDVISQPVRSVLEHPAAGWTLALGVGSSLWIAAGYVGSFGRAMNRIYGVEEGRPALQLLGWHLLTTLVLVVFATLVTLFAVVSGPVARAVGQTLEVEASVTVWELARWPVVLLAGLVVISLLYFTTPNVRYQRFRLVSPGSLLALGIALVASFGFQLYLRLAGYFETTYGATLAGIVVLVLWLWLINISLLLGAELDRELARARQLVSGVEADRRIQVDVRDQRASHRAAARRSADEARARSLRESWTDGRE
ncbi:YihY/virulence factor BrkB family protein [Oceanitalea stevensii]|uniref:YihY/virulence factor BrkB family protein n=1 Tax=Oceanitalea stevensii TaxID=2763072 RepID=A0ABR8Z124_9MICO|nr:YihY/virulence factor BrkB family protein [Oceanitalea stevensii]MBD8061738.1 YihY/virulence factor BrkB family protein [Oceanitalea stevensii]